MANKSVKKLGRKALSMLLTLTMVTSMLQISVLAADSYKDQTMDGYYTVDAQGNAANTEATSVTENGENVVVINYVRAKADYQIIHIYNRNGIEEGRTSATLGGLDGDVVLADSIARVNTYNGSTYAFVSATGDPIAVYAAISALSGMGLAALNLTGKKRKDEE